LDQRVLNRDEAFAAELNVQPVIPISTSSDWNIVLVARQSRGLEYYPMMLV
jgi:hypothetical protein